MRFVITKCLFTSAISLVWHFLRASLARGCCRSYHRLVRILAIITGPLTHIPQIAFWVILYGLLTDFDYSNFYFTIYLLNVKYGGATAFFETLAEQAVELNTILIIFNLFVPAFPLDGGRCLAALLVQCGTRVQRAAVMTAVTAMVIAVGLLSYGIFNVVVQGQGPGLITILIALYIFSSSNQLLQMAKQGNACDHPLFNRACYRQVEQQSGADGSGSNSGVEMGRDSHPTIAEDYGLS